MTAAEQPVAPPKVLIGVTVSDLHKSIEFYTKAFGFTLVTNPAGGDHRELRDLGLGSMAEMQFHDVQLILFTEGSFGRPHRTPAHTGVRSPVTLTLYCDDVESYHARAMEAGANEIRRAHRTYWGDHMALVEDPDGYVWSVAQRVGEFDPAGIAPMAIENLSRALARVEDQLSRLAPGG